MSNKSTRGQLSPLAVGGPLPWSGPVASPQAIATVARRLEAAGFDFVSVRRFAEEAGRDPSMIGLSARVNVGGEALMPGRSAGAADALLQRVAQLRSLGFTDLMVGVDELALDSVAELLERVDWFSQNVMPELRSICLVRCPGIRGGADRLRGWSDVAPRIRVLDARRNLTV